MGKRGFFERDQVRAAVCFEWQKLIEQSWEEGMRIKLNVIIAIILLVVCQLSFAQDASVSLGKEVEALNFLEKGKRVSVATKTANIRSEPDTQARVIWVADRYYPLIIVDERDGWFKVEDFEGDVGWIHGSVVGKVNSVVVKLHSINVRGGPGTDNPVIFVAVKGVAFKVVGTQGNWINVEHPDGDVGWLHKKLIW